MDLLLGWDTIRGNNIDIISSKDTAVLRSVDDLELPTQVYKGARALAPLSLVCAEEIVLTPGAEAYAMRVKVPRQEGDLWQGLVHGVAEGCAEGTLSLTDGEGTISTRNGSAWPLTLRRGTVVASFVPATGDSTGPTAAATMALPDPLAGADPVVGLE